MQGDGRGNWSARPSARTAHLAAFAPSPLSLARGPLSLPRAGRYVKPTPTPTPTPMPITTSIKSSTVMRNKTPGQKPSADNFDPSVYLVTDRNVPSGRTVEQVVEAAIHGNGTTKGVTFVQLRDKHETATSTLELANKLRELTARTNTAFVINDDVHLAKAVGADGVHVGQEDTSVDAARKILGPHAIIGVSAGTCGEAECAIKDGADYIGVGSVYATLSKPDAGDAIGVDALARIVETVARRIPVVAIGGIGLTNVLPCWRAGVDGIAVVSSIMRAHHPKQVASRLYDSKPNY